MQHNTFRKVMERFGPLQVEKEPNTSDPNYTHYGIYRVVWAPNPKASETVIRWGVNPKNTEVRWIRINGREAKTLDDVLFYLSKRTKVTKDFCHQWQVQLQLILSKQGCSGGIVTLGPGGMEPLVRLEVSSDELERVMEMFNTSIAVLRDWLMDQPDPFVRYLIERLRDMEHARQTENLRT